MNVNFGGIFGLTGGWEMGVEGDGDSSFAFLR